MTDPSHEGGDEPTNDEAASGRREVTVERIVTRDDAAAALRKLADGVANGSVTLGGDDPVTATVPARFELTIEYELADEAAELEAELEWSLDDGEAVAAELDRESPARDADERGADAAGGTGAADTTDVGGRGESAVPPGTGDPIGDVVGTGGATSNARFELYRDRADEWRWRLIHDNGNIIADSGEGYDRRTTARNGLESVMRNAPGATVVDLED